MQKMQPEDEWTFLGVDDFIDDGEIDQVDREMERSVEETAMHVERIDRQRRPAVDPASSDTAAVVDEGDSVPVARFDDEQPEVGELEPTSNDHEPEIDEILESQNFLFSEDKDDLDN